MNEYKSPIEIVQKIHDNFEAKIIEDTICVIRSYGINVNKEELIKALKYDRQQYDAGYTDGIKDQYNLLKEFVEWEGEEIKRNLVGVSKESEALVYEIIAWFDSDLEKFLEERKDERLHDNRDN